MGKALADVTQNLRLMVIQFGDYRQALLAREARQPETYRAQYYSMDCFDKVVSHGYGLIVCLDTELYDLNWGKFHLVGDRFIPAGGGWRYLRQAWLASKRLISLAKQYAPTHLIIRTPDWPMLFVGGWALREKIPVLPLFADYFYAGTVKARIKNFPLIRMLNRPEVALVANHNYPACTSMALAGVDRQKIVPYDWPAINNPRTSVPKELAPNEKSFRLVYAGQVSAQKGVGDLLQALARLVEGGMNLELDIFGAGPEKDDFETMVGRLQVANRVRFHGLTANTTVLDTMRQAHLVVVPSRHAYPEGIPCVIYESLETRTPVIISDHPSFLPKLRDGRGCLIFQAGNVADLATRLRECLLDSKLYKTLSETTVSAWDAIQCSVTFGQLIDDWLALTLKKAELGCRHFFSAMG
jgi:glycosyltransferase involved in cell wall biosynthesis